MFGCSTDCTCMWRLQQGASWEDVGAVECGDYQVVMSAVGCGDDRGVSTCDCGRRVFRRFLAASSLSDHHSSPLHLQSENSCYIWVIVALGVPGNIASLLTLTSMTMTTSIFYVTLLAGTDLLALVLKLVFHQLSNHNIPLYDVGCKFGLFVEVVSCYASWTLVLICFERFLAVCYPLKRNAYFTQTKAVTIAVVIAIIIFLCYLYAIILRQFDPDKLCGFFNGPPGFTQYWIWTASILYSLLPFVLLAVLTVFIIHSLRKHFRSRHTLHATSGVEQSFSRAEFAICVMMVAATVVFLFLTLPSCVYFVLYEAHVLNYDKGVDLQIITLLTEEFSKELADLSHGINFYIYFLTNGRFRARFKQLLHKIC